MKTRGKFRLYYNRHGAEPLMFCVAPEEGNWEIAVVAVSIEVPSWLRFQAKATPDEDGKPSAWVACEGELEVHASGLARITP